MEHIRMKKLTTAALAVAALAFGAAPASAHLPDLGTTQNWTHDLSVQKCYEYWPSSCWGGAAYLSCGEYGDHSRLCRWRIYSTRTGCYKDLYWFVGHSYDIWKYQWLGSC